MFSKRLRLTWEWSEDSLGSLDVNIACLRINRRTRGRVAQINRITQKIVVALLPYFFSSLRVKASHTLLEVRPFTEETHDVKATIGDYGCGLSRKRYGPKWIGRINFDGQPCF